MFEVFHILAGNLDGFSGKSLKNCSAILLRMRRFFAGTVCRSNRKRYSQVQNFMTRQQILDLYFMEARAKVIDLAAFMDRVERASGEEDFRMKAFREALKELDKGNADRAKRVLFSLSDPTEEPIEMAHGKGASGAWPEKK
jgi:hypothetical protein